METSTEDRADVVDARPETSPYNAQSIRLNLANDRKLFVAPDLLDKWPKLGRTVNLYRSTVSLLDVQHEEGHVLIHFLYTGTYQSLRSKRSSVEERLQEEFATCARVYALARNYEIMPLKNLAQEEMERLGEEIPFSAILRLIQTAYPEPSADDTWLSSYLKNGLEAILDHPDAEAELRMCSSNSQSDGAEADGKKTATICEMLFWGLADLVRDRRVLTLSASSTSGRSSRTDSASSDHDSMSVISEPLSVCSKATKGEQVVEKEPISITAVDDHEFLEITDSEAESNATVEEPACEAIPEATTYESIPPDEDVLGCKEAAAEAPSTLDPETDEPVFDGGLSKKLSKKEKKRKGKKGKSKKAKLSKPEPEPEPEPVPELVPEPAPEPKMKEETPAVDVDVSASWGAPKKSGKASATKTALFEDDDSYLGVEKTKAVEPEYVYEVCEKAVGATEEMSDEYPCECWQEHSYEDGWRRCDRCQAHILWLASQI